MIDIELPLKKRSRLYRFFEIVPGVMSYSIIVLVGVLSFFSPFLATIYLLIIIITMAVKACGIAFHSVAGYRKLIRAQSTDWSDRLRDLEDPISAFTRLDTALEKTRQEPTVHYENLRLVAAQPDAYMKPSEVMNVVIMAAYNEPFEVIDASIGHLASIYEKSSLQMVFVLAYEERGGLDIERTSERLEEKYAKSFSAFHRIKHPDGLKDEVIGKGANISYAGKQLEKRFMKEGVNFNNVIITTLDTDNKPYSSYFEYVTYEFIVRPNRKQLSFQPISLYFSNIWDAPAPMRIIAIGNSFWTITSAVRPHMLRNFAAHSQPMEALREMNYWSTRSIVEDGHQYWRSYFFFGGNYEVIPIYVPIYQDAVVAKDLKTTLKAQFVQLRRWGYGVSDIPYVAVRLFSRTRNVPFWPAFARFLRLVDSHVSLAAIAIVVAIGGWVPLAINPDAQSSIIAHNLPGAIGQIQFVAMVGLCITIILTVRLLPPRPPRYGRRRTIGMVAQWVLMPFTAIGYSAAASLNAQTHLLLGRYLTKFDVTEKTKR
jgi:hypothetical protein